MENEQVYNLLAKHFSKQTTEQEEGLINLWLKSDPLNKEKYDELRNIWANTHFSSNDWNVDNAWQKVSEKTETKMHATDFYSVKKKVFFGFQHLKIAAVMLIMLGGYYLLTLTGVLNTNQNTDSKWVEKVTRPGEKMELTLQDNSKLILNASGKIKYPVNFHGDKREVFLEGEAYFEIAHNPDKPFIVHSGNISTTVLGTKFNVSAFANERNISVALIEGKVKVSKAESNRIDPIVILQPHQQLVYNNEEKISTIEQFDIDKTIGWKDNILKFDNEPLSEVFTRLERAYGSKFKLNGNQFKNYKVTANFKKESCLTVAEVLQKLTGLKMNIVKENNEVKEIFFSDN